MLNITGALASRLMAPYAPEAYSWRLKAKPYIPANKKHLCNICTMLDQRRRRWADGVQMLYKCFVFAGTILNKQNVDGCMDILEAFQ